MTTIEKRLDYPRDEVHQDTGWNCGPATAQTLIRAAAKRFIPESTLAAEMGTHRGGTDWIGQVTRTLQKHIPAAKYATVEMPNDPPTSAQRERLWQHLTGSIDAGYGLAVNIVAPPNNYPRPSFKSTQALQYSGGTVYHYVAAMGYAIDGNGVKHVWLADSGFRPYGSWITFAQFATLIPPKGYAYATARATTPTPPPKEEHTMPATPPPPPPADVLALDQLAGPRDADGQQHFKGWPQLGDRTVVDALAAIGERLEIDGFKAPRTL